MKNEIERPTDKTNEFGDSPIDINKLNANLTRQLEEARAALRVTLDHYSLFVGPDDAIANAVKQQANAALPEHREQQP